MNSDKAWAFDVHAFYIVVAHWMVRSAHPTLLKQTCVLNNQAPGQYCVRANMVDH
jgi:hypothetical protein